MRSGALSLVLAALVAIISGLACTFPQPSETAPEVPEASAAMAPVPGTRAAARDICAALQAGAPPSSPPVIPDDDPVVRVLAFGDFGEQPGRGRDLGPQRRLARAMADYARTRPFDFGLTLGDNFYPRGLASPTDPRWETQWENLYGVLGIRFYATLGNHDYFDAASPAAEIARSALSASWCLPRRYYTFVAGPVQFFAVDTTPVEEPKYGTDSYRAGQRRWLEEALAASRAPWKVVYAHHPIYTNGDHALDHRPKGTLPAVKAYLLPLLVRHRVDVYLAGHDHDLEALEPEDGVHFFISGAAGRRVEPFDSHECRLWGLPETYGFAVLEADAAGRSLTVSFVGYNDDGTHRRLESFAVVKGATSSCARN